VDAAKVDQPGFLAGLTIAAAGEGGHVRIMPRM
jgi:hypothetical protein